MSLNTGNAILSNAITVDGSYNVGIGTSSPNALLEVTSRIVASNGGGASRVALNIESNGTGTAYSAINSYNYGTSSARPLIINESVGYVGIGGASTPAYNLDVTGTGRFSGKLNANVALSDTAGTFALAMNGDYAGLRTGTDGSFNVDVYKSGTGYINPFKIASTGAATFSGDVTMSSTSNYGGILTFGLASNGGTINWSSTDLQIYSKASKGLLIGVNASTTALTISSTGAATFSGDVTIDTNTFFVDSTNNRVGIGLTNPAGLFHIKSLSGNAQMFLQNSAGTETLSITQNTIQTASATNLILGTDGVPRLTIASTGAATFSSGIATNGYTASTSYAALFAGNVGIGTATPSTYLQVAGGNVLIGSTSSPGTLQLGDYAANQNAKFVFSASGNNSLDIQTNYASGANLIKLSPGGATAMTLLGSGNVGIGTSSPLAPFVVSNGGGIGMETLVTVLPDSSAGSYIQTYNRATSAFVTMGFNASEYRWYLSNTERMRITSDGYVLVGMTNTSTTGIGTMFSNGGAFANLRLFGTGSQTFVSFFIGGSASGSITGSGSSTSYNTSSDYRLKQDFKDYNALSILNNIKTYDFEWKSDKSRMHGVIAHELQEILPYAVTGEKDGEIIQGVDYSKIVPVLVKAIQEQQAQIEELKALINK